MRALPSNRLTRKTDPRLVTPVVVFLIFLAGVLVFGLFVGTPERNWIVWKGVAVFLPVACLMLTPAYFSDLGYQVGWDEEGIYARSAGWRFEALAALNLSPSDRMIRDDTRRKGPSGWFERLPITFMRFGDITSIGDPAISKQPDRPTVYIKGRPETSGLYNDLIGIDLESFTRGSVLELMEVLHSKRPDLVPQGWAKPLARRRGG